MRRALSVINNLQHRRNWSSTPNIPAESSGSLCYNCHMPSIVYGVMSAHRTHDITIPRPEETVRFDKPNACNQCHLDWSVNRAIAASQRLWPNAFIDSKIGDKRFDEPEGQRALFAGDAVMRGLTAAAMTPANDVTGRCCWKRCRTDIRLCDISPQTRSQPGIRPCPSRTIWPAQRSAMLRSRLGIRYSCRRRLRAAKEARERLSANRVEVDVEVGE